MCMLFVQRNESGGLVQFDMLLCRCNRCLMVAAGAVVAGGLCTAVQSSCLTHTASVTSAAAVRIVVVPLHGRVVLISRRRIGGSIVNWSLWPPRLFYACTRLRRSRCRSHCLPVELRAVAVPPEDAGYEYDVLVETASNDAMNAPAAYLTLSTM